MLYMNYIMYVGHRGEVSPAPLATRSAAAVWPDPAHHIPADAAAQDRRPHRVPLLWHWHWHWWAARCGRPKSIIISSSSSTITAHHSGASELYHLSPRPSLATYDTASSPALRPPPQVRASRWCTTVSVAPVGGGRRWGRQNSIYGEVDGVLLIELRLLVVINVARYGWLWQLVVIYSYIYSSSY